MEFLVLLVVTLGATILAVSVATVILTVLFRLMEGGMIRLARGNAPVRLGAARSVNG